MMSRRRFLASLGAGTLAAPLTAEAQPARQVYRVGFIFSSTPLSETVGPEPINPAIRVFVHGLRDVGYIEGQNLILERRSAEGRFERFGDIVAEFVRLKVDVIVTPTDAMTRAAKALTTTVPIVMAGAGDPVALGFVQSLARPGGNITGLTAMAGPGISAKRLELLKEALPRVARIAFLGGKEEKDWENYARTLPTAAQALGITLVPAEFTSHQAHQFDDAFTLISHARPGALFVAMSAAAYVHRRPIVDYATRARLPSSFHFREAVELGGLMSYGVNIPDMYRRAATYVDKILKGAKPADLPVEQPTKFDLVINLKTARALGLTIPRSVLGIADEVIQ